MTKRAKNSKVLQLVERKRYGKIYIHVIGDLDQIAITQLTGRMTVNEKDLEALRILGVDFVIERLYNERRGA